MTINNNFGEKSLYGFIEMKTIVLSITVPSCEGRRLYAQGGIANLDDTYTYNVAIFPFVFVKFA